MLDYTAMILAIGPELWLAAAGLVGVLLGALLKDRFNGLSFKFGALALFGAAALSLVFYQGGEAFGGLVRTNTFVNFAKFVSFSVGGFALVMSEGFLRRHDTIRSCRPDDALHGHRDPEPVVLRAGGISPRLRTLV